MRKHYREVLVRHRPDSVVRAVHHRNGRAQVALTGNTPVLETEYRFALAEAFGLSMRGHGIDGVFDGKAVIRPGVHKPTVLMFVKCRGHFLGINGLAFERLNHYAEGQAVFPAEL